MKQLRNGKCLYICTSAAAYLVTRLVNAVEHDCESTLRLKLGEQMVPTKTTSREKVASEKVASNSQIQMNTLPSNILFVIYF